MSNSEGPSSAKYPRYSDGDDIPIEDREGYGRETVEGEYRSKHTLDSDEEEDVKYNKLDMSKLEGQEEAGEEVRAESNITAFNMKEDLEEGHFDSEGNFIYNKKEKEIKDAWLDNIDWANVKDAAGDQWHKIEDSNDDPNIRELTEDELKNICKSILPMLKPGETIERALRRIGKQKGVSAAEERKRRWAAKKEGKKYVDEGTTAMKELTGFADSLVTAGEMEAYQYTLEKLQYRLHQMEHKAVDELDMFSGRSASSFASAEENVVTEEKAGPEVMWEYKMSEAGDAEILGPVSTADILKMQKEGKFDEGGIARKVGSKAFYSCKRIDFELYI